MWDVPTSGDRADVARTDQNLRTSRLDVGRRTFAVPRQGEHISGAPRTSVPGYSCCLLRAELRVDDLSVSGATGQQGLMRPIAGDQSVFQHDYVIRGRYGGDTLAHNDQGRLARFRLQRCAQPRVGRNIQCGEGIVKYV